MTARLLWTANADTGFEHPMQAQNQISVKAKPESQQKHLLYKQDVIPEGLHSMCRQLYRISRKSSRIKKINKSRSTKLSPQRCHRRSEPLYSHLPRQ